MKANLLKKSSAIRGIIEKYDSQGCTVTLNEFPSGDPTYIEVGALKVPKDKRNQGIGTSFMEDVVRYADQVQRPIFLTPFPNDGSTMGRLKKFYKRFGFVPNTGRNKDFVSRESMIRKPILGSVKPRDYIHYTYNGALKSISRQGLIPSVDGNNGPGVYLWVSRPISESRADALTLRISPYHIEDVLDKDYAETLPIGAEFVVDHVKPRYLEWLDGRVWRSVIQKTASHKTPGQTEDPDYPEGSNGWANDPERGKGTQLPSLEELAPQLFKEGSSDIIDIDWTQPLGELIAELRRYKEEGGVWLKSPIPYSARIAESDAGVENLARPVWNSGSTQLISPEKLVSPQKEVQVFGVLFFLENPSQLNAGQKKTWWDEFPIVLEKNGRFYLEEGNHRATAALVLGQKLRVTFVNMNHRIAGAYDGQLFKEGSSSSHAQMWNHLVDMGVPGLALQIPANYIEFDSSNSLPGKGKYDRLCFVNAWETAKKDPSMKWVIGLAIDKDNFDQQVEDWDNFSLKYNFGGVTCLVHSWNVTPEGRIYDPTMGRDAKDYYFFGRVVDPREAKTRLDTDKFMNDVYKEIELPSSYSEEKVQAYYDALLKRRGKTAGAYDGKYGEKTLDVQTSEGYVKGFTEYDGELKFQYPGQLVAYIAHVQVYPKFRRSGVGLKLVQEFLQKAKEAGAVACYLYAVGHGNLSNEELHQFYEKAGFRDAGRGRGTMMSMKLASKPVEFRIETDEDDINKMASMRPVSVDALPRDTKGDIAFILFDKIEFLQRKLGDADELYPNLFGLADEPMVLSGSLPVRSLYATMNRAVSERAAERYTAMLKANPSFEFDPILVANGQHLEGAHRMEAYYRAGRQTIPVIDVSNLLDANLEMWDQWINGENITAAQAFPIHAGKVVPKTGKTANFDAWFSSCVGWTDKKTSTQQPPANLRLAVARGLAGPHPYLKPHEEILTVTATINGKEVGFAEFVVKKSYLLPNNTTVPVNFRRKGIASAMYAKAEEESGLRIHMSSSRTTDGDALWNKNDDRKFGSLEAQLLRQLASTSEYNVRKDEKTKTIYIDGNETEGGIGDDTLAQLLAENGAEGWHVMFRSPMDDGSQTDYQKMAEWESRDEPHSRAKGLTRKYEDRSGSYYQAMDYLTGDLCGYEPWKKTPLTFVSADELKRMYHGNALDPEKLRKLRYDSGLFKKKPRYENSVNILRTDDGDLIVDGNHRVASATQHHEGLHVRILDVRGLTPEDLDKINWNYDTPKSYLKKKNQPKSLEEGKSASNKTADEHPIKDIKHVLGLPIYIEFPKGSTRHNKKMLCDYGFIPGTSGKDGDDVDVYLGPNHYAPHVYIVEQLKADGSFDEHKVLMGFSSLEEAEKAYLAQYDEGWRENRVESIEEAPTEEFLAVAMEKSDA